MTNETTDMITPWEAFIAWFDSVPLALRRQLSHVFRICTTEDTSQMAVQPEDSLGHFRNWVNTKDFPLRITARMFYIRSVFDLVICHHKEILTKNISDELNNNESVIPLSDKQWDEVLRSWATLRNSKFSDKYIHSWASWMIRLQKEAS
nr:hypothetical protein [uncultured Desulfobacter sp.]